MLKQNLEQKMMKKDKLQEEVIYIFIKFYSSYKEFPTFVLIY